MSPRSATLSVVVPAFNEEAYIGDCLRSLLHQIDQIDEVIVVDNGSTDGTRSIVADIAGSCDKVRLLTERRRGVIPARNTGLGAASAEILARIDADTYVDPGWAQAIRTFFSTNHEYDAATGPFSYHDGPNFRWRDRLPGKAADRPDRSAWRPYGGGVYGANMAIRREVWHSLRDDLHDRPDIWEDADLNAALFRCQRKRALLYGMAARVSARRFLTSPRSFWTYTRRGPTTLRLNGMRLAATLSWIAIWFRRLSYLAYWVPIRTYNPSSGNYDLRRLFKRRGEAIPGGA